MSICSIESEIHHNVLLFSVTGEKRGNNVRRAAVWNRNGIKLKYSRNSSEISLVLKHRTIAIVQFFFHENTWPTSAFYKEGRGVLYEEDVSC